jgi:hypothetical protein
MAAQSAAMENLICAFCGKGNHPIEACCHPDAPLGSCLDGWPHTKHKVINNQHALVKALKDGETAKDWKNHVNTNSDHRPPKADKPEHKRKTHDKKDKGGKYEKKYKARASKIEQLEQMHTDLLARLEKGCGGRCGWLWELSWGCFSFSGVLGRWLVVVVGGLYLVALLVV